MANLGQPTFQVPANSVGEGQTATIGNVPPTAPTAQQVAPLQTMPPKPWRYPAVCLIWLYWSVFLFALVGLGIGCWGLYLVCVFNLCLCFK